MLIYKLYNDFEIFNKEYPANMSVAAIAREQGIVGRPRLVVHCGVTKTYRVDGSGYRFTVSEVNQC